MTTNLTSPLHAYKVLIGTFPQKRNLLQSKSEVFEILPYLQAKNTPPWCQSDGRGHEISGSETNDFSTYSTTTVTCFMFTWSPLPDSPMVGSGSDKNQKNAIKNILKKIF